MPRIRARWVVASVVLVVGVIAAYMLWPRSIEFRARQIVERMTAQDTDFLYDVLLDKEFDTGITRANFDQAWRQFIAPTMRSRYSSERFVRFADVVVYPNAVTVTCVYKDASGGVFEITWFIRRRGNELRLELFQLLAEAWIDQLGTRENNLVAYYSALLAGLKRDLSLLDAMGIRGFVVIEDDPATGKLAQYVLPFSEYKAKVEAWLKSPPSDA